MELAKTYGLDIPSTTLRGLLDKLEKEKYVNKQIRNKRRPDSHLYNLSEYGFLYSITYTGSEAKINNKIKDLFEDIKKFLTSKVEIDANIKLPENNDQVREIVIEYVHKNIASLLSMIYQDYAIDSFLFSWNEIPGKDNERITKYIDQEFNIDWIKNADIEKINDNEIRIFSGKNTISLNLNSEKTRVKININDVKTDLFQVKNENGNLNIYYDSMGSSQHKFDRYLSEYMKREKEENSEYYNTMVDIIHGSLTSYAFNSEKFCKNQDELRNLSVFIYTNFLLYLLGYHYDDFSVPANELYVLMNMREIKLKVFSFTLKEATNVLTYCKNYVETVKGMDVDSICYYLKSEKNMKRNNFEVEISNFREKISSLGIEIVNEDINFDNEKKELIKDMEKKLEEFRYNKFKDSSNSEDLERAKRRRLHDIAAILKIKQYRNKDAFNLKEAIAVFLTADQNLATYNYTKQLLDNQSHRDSGTIPEVIVDKFLTDILWQKDPSSNISVESLIATCSRNSYIPPYVWREIINIFKSNNKDFEKNLTAILTHERFREMAKDAESPNDIYKALSDVNKEIESQKKEIKLRAATPT